MKLSFAILLSTAAILGATLQNPVWASKEVENWDDDFDLSMDESARKKTNNPVASSSNAAAASSATIADLDEDDWDNDFFEAPAISTATSSAPQKKGDPFANRMALAAYLQSLQLSAEPTRLSITSPHEPKSKKASTLSYIKDDSDVKTVTAIHLQADAQSSSSNPEELDWDDESASASDPEPTVEVERKTPEQARREQLWSKKWYTRNSARSREARLLLDQGKPRAAQSYIDEAAKDNYPHALFHQAQALIELGNNTAAQAKFDAAIRAVIARESEMDDQSVDGFLHNVGVLKKDNTFLTLPSEVLDLEAESKIRKKLTK